MISTTGMHREGGNTNHEASQFVDRERERSAFFRHVHHSSDTFGYHKTSSDEDNLTESDCEVGPEEFGFNRYTYDLLRYKTHLLMEDSTSSSLAFAISLCSMILVLLSCIFFVVESVPEYSRHVHPSLGRFWFYADALFSVLFTTEYVVRLWVANRSTASFVLDKMNVVDLLAVLPFWLQFAERDTLGVNLKWVRVFRLIRIFRVFKLAKASFHMKVLVLAVTEAKDSLVLLALFIAIAVFMFASLIWYAERGAWDHRLKCFAVEGECSDFQSIPDCFYWAITTMTTVGYGDMVPVSIGGRFIAAIAMVAGIFVIAMPVSVLGSQFQSSFTTQTDEAHFLSMFSAGGELDIEKVKGLLSELVNARATLRRIFPEVRAIVEDGRGVVPIPLAVTEDPEIHNKLKTITDKKVASDLRAVRTWEKNLDLEFSIMIQLIEESLADKGETNASSSQQLPPLVRPSGVHQQ